MDFSAITAIAIPEGNVVQIEAGGKVLWKSGPLPAAYQQVEWIRSSSPSSTSSGAYIDLGFAFDTAATIYLSITSHLTASQPFGAAENSGVLRCMISFSGGAAIFYGSNGSKYLSTATTGGTITGKRANLKFTLKKGMLAGEDTLNGVKATTSSSQVEYTMTRNLYLFAQNYNTAVRFAGSFTVYSFQYYDKNGDLICDLIPCYRKSDGEIGMYDIVRKIFLTNAGSGSFTKGADV